MQRCADEIQKKYGVTVSFDKPQAVESPATPADAAVVKKLAEAIKAVSKVEPRPIGIGGGTVGAYLRKAGYKAVVWSRMDETAHQPNEYTIIDNLVNDAEVLAYLMCNA